MAPLTQGPLQRPTNSLSGRADVTSRSARLRDDLRRHLVSAGYRITGQRRLPSNLGWQLRLAAGQFVNIYDTGSLLVQGVDRAPVKRVLRSFIVPASISNQRESEWRPKKAKHTLPASTPLPDSATSGTIRPEPATTNTLVDEDRWGEKTSYTVTRLDGEVAHYTTTPMETTVTCLEEIYDYKVVAKVRREHHGRPGWLLKLSTGDAVWVDDYGAVWVLSNNQDLKRRFRRSTW